MKYLIFECDEVTMTPQFTMSTELRLYTKMYYKLYL